MRKSSKFGALLEATDGLSLDEKEMLVELVHKRAAEQRRAQLKREIAQANRQHAAGKAKPASVRRIMRDILK